MRFNTSLPTRVVLVGLALLCAGPGHADTHLPALPDADIYLLGELHDQAEHHVVQAELVSEITPSAIVFEMLSPDQASSANGVSRTDMAALDAAIRWSESPWPPFEMYFPIFAAAPGAVIYGAALDSQTVRSAFSDGAAEVFGKEANKFGLDAPLPDAEQEQREEAQAIAHCNALPPEMLGGMVEAQRLRDAHFSRVALQAFKETGGPVVVITGNGHVRKDWGMPVYLKTAAPSVQVFSLAQGANASSGEMFDTFLATGIVPSGEDPCDAFKSN